MRSLCLIQRKAQRHILRRSGSSIFCLSKLDVKQGTIRVRCFSAGPVTSRLEELIRSGDIHADGHQNRAAKELDRLYDDLMTNNDPAASQPTTSTSGGSSHSPSDSVFGGFFGGSSPSDAVARIVRSPISGTYLFGGVGCGKTFLMNILYDAIDTGSWSQNKQKVHYHKFMLEVHQHMHEQRKLDPQGDLISPVVDQVLQNGRLLCLDEFQVTDVADALILQRLFEGLWDEGCVLVATSNRPPSDLYLNGLQRDRFLPFIDLLEQQCAIINLLDSEKDYRMVLSNFEENNNDNKKHPFYFSNGEANDFDKIFRNVTDGFPIHPTALETQGRKVPIPLACPPQKVAKFSFDDLCRKALGAADYLVIGQQFSTVFCHDIPKLTIDHVNWLRRFITFVDSMYELKVKLVLHTQAESIDDIFVVENKEEYSQDEVFAFDRTRSRLEEMAGSKYLKSKWIGDSTKSSGKGA